MSGSTGTIGTRSDFGVWVVGRGGLLGGSVESAARVAGHDVFSAPPIVWADKDRAVSELGAALESFLRENRQREWAVLWCAGAGVTNTAREDLDAELRTFELFLGRFDRSLVGHDASRGRMFLASSAGGAYGGSEHPPFTESSEVVPVSAYGETKLAMERLVSEFAERSSLPVVIGRIANLYGPGQNLAKAQGLISQLCHSYLTSSDLSLFADPAAVRDYIYADDCAAMILAACRGEQSLTIGSAAVVKNLCSGRAVSVGEVLNVFSNLFGAPEHIRIPEQIPPGQTLDLRLASTVGAGLQAHVTTGLDEGVRRVMEAMAAGAR